VFECRLLRRISGIYNRGLRKVHNEGFHNLLAIPNTIRMKKLLGKRGAAYSMHGKDRSKIEMKEKRIAYRNVFEKPRGKRNLKDLVIDGRILKWILKKQDMTVWPGFIWLRIRTGARLCEHSNKPFVFHKLWGISLGVQQSILP
jgi:hypothetical protein